MAEGFDAFVSNAGLAIVKIYFILFYFYFILFYFYFILLLFYFIDILLYFILFILFIFSLLKTLDVKFISKRRRSTRQIY